jgi:hypothetical protein
MRLPISLSTESLTCPLCGGGDFMPSRRREVLDYLLAMTLLRPFRCTECSNRQFAFFFIKRVSQSIDPDLQEGS